MANQRRFTASHDGERGYALLFVLFLVALVVIGASTAVLSVRTEGQREKEAMTIWRGRQYQRAIGMFYRKYGRFPTRIDDLVKVQQGGIRFLREPYQNPMNKQDGSWRFIYVTPAGQLIGSVRYVSLQQMAFLDKQRQMGMAAGAGGASDDSNDSSADENSAAGVTGANGAGNSNISGLSAPGAAPGMPNRAPGQNPSAPPQPSFFSQPLQMQTNSAGGFSVNEQAGAGSGSDEPVIGGFIIGVAGKSERASIKIYKGGATYKQWEFIFNPLEQVQTIGGMSTGPQNTPNGAQPNQPVPQTMPQQQLQIPQ